jgi:uncharacterized membrane protein
MDTNSSITDVPSRAVATGRGLDWIREGFALFMSAPVAWLINIVLFALMIIVIGMLPLVNLLTNIFVPVFMAGFMLGCRSLDAGESMTVNHLFAGFQQHAKPLLGAGLLNLGLTVGIFAVAALLSALFGLTGILGGEEAVTPAMTIGLLLVLLITMLLALPLAMAFWFAPALLIFNRQLPVVAAFKLSFSACLKNIMPFTVFGLVAMVLAVIASIPLMLGLLVLAPVMIAANYCAYKDIFEGGN